VSTLHQRTGSTSPDGEVGQIPHTLQRTYDPLSLYNGDLDQTDQVSHCTYVRRSYSWAGGQACLGYGFLRETRSRAPQYETVLLVFICSQQKLQCLTFRMYPIDTMKRWRNLQIPAPENSRCLINTH
jgi:hypothetical protein